jgi:hypothetical protein
VDNDERDGFVEEHQTRKQIGQNKRKQTRNHQRDGGKRIHRVEGKQKWHWNKNVPYDED